MRDVLHVEPLRGYDPTIGQWLWAMEEVRRRTVRLVRDLDRATLDWRGTDGEDNSIGSLLYHIGLIEMSWLFLDVLEQELPPEVRAEFPFEGSDAAGRLTHVASVPASDHLRRLERTREIFLGALRGMTLEDWSRLRRPGDVEYRVSPAWAVFHLVEHEAGHAFQIGAQIARARRLLGEPGDGA